MSMVKFECPACGQNMECDRSRGGDVIHCVGCGSELRIPFSSAKTGLASVERAEVLVPASAPQPSDPNERNASSTTQKTIDPPERPPSSPMKPIEATCPVCQSLLRFDPGSASDDNRQSIVELVHRHEESQVEKAHAPEQPHPPVPGKPNHHTLSFEEREKQIAEGRKSHPISLYPAQKPRLEYILSGGAAPGSDSAKKDPEQTTDCHNGSDSLSE